MSKNVLVPVLVAAALSLLVVFNPRTQVARHAGSPEELAHRAFLALQADDFSVLAPAVVSPSDIEATFDRAPDGGTAMRQRAARRGGVDALAAQARSRVEASFAEARARSAREIDWKRARFVGLDAARKHTQRSGTDTADVQFLVEEGGKQVPVLLSQTFRGEKGWVMVGGLVYRPIQEGTPEYDTLKKLERVASGVMMHRAIHKALPASLDVLLQPEPHTGDPLVPFAPVDAWGRPLHYQPREDGGFFVGSFGPDGQPGTNDDITFEPR